ncbi:unnamed protein product [Brassica oleracea]
MVYVDHHDQQRALKHQIAETEVDKVGRDEERVDSEEVTEDGGGGGGEEGSGEGKRGA